MISGGNATVFVSNMDAAIDFYTETLGLKLTNRFGNNWATVQAGAALTVGLHPASPDRPAPGTKGSMMLGLEISEPIAAVISRLSKKGIRFGPVVRGEAGSFVHFEDTDGNEIYFWEVNREAVPQRELAGASSAKP